MGVIRPLRTILAENTDTLSFTPPAGRAAIVEDISVIATDMNLATVRSAGATIIQWMVGSALLSHIYPAPSTSKQKNVLQFLKEKGINVEIPVPEGEKFVVTLPTSVDYILAKYREVTPDEIKPELPNWKGSKTFLRVFYGTNKNDITSSGWYRLDKSLNAKEMHNFPYEEVSSPFEKTRLLGLAMLEAEYNNYDGTNDHYARTVKTRLWRGTELILTEDENGFLTYGNGASSGAVNIAYGKGKNELPWNGGNGEGNIFMFKEPIELVRGDELGVEVYVEVEDSDAKIPAEKLYFAIFAEVTLA